MKRNIIFSIILSIITLTFFSCGTGKNIDLSGVNANDTIFVSVNDTFKIELVSNPSTGYRWFYAENKAEKNVKLLDDKFIMPKGNLMGASGKQLFLFFAKKKGKTVVNLESRRGKGAPAKKYVAIVKIKK